jgi:hypothetical protein
MLGVFLRSRPGKTDEWMRCGFSVVLLNVLLDRGQISLSICYGRLDMKAVFSPIGFSTLMAT